MAAHDTMASARRFDGKVVIVTGGGRGIGEATVHRFAAEGARVMLVDIDAAGAERVAGDVATAETSGEVAVCIADVCTGEGIDRMVAESDERWGRLDVVVNNAVSPDVGQLLALGEEGWQRTFDSSVTAVWRSAKAAVPIMARGGGGAFVNISTNAALAAVPGLGAYGAAKAGVIQLTRQIAVECAAQGIRANSITPGVIMSPMIAALVGTLDRRVLDAELVTGPGEPAQLAAVVAFLASADASYVNGENIQVDGGWFAKRSPGGMTFGIPT
jgi:meso-butanediol dehydrogenase / (S,S)-butanediol dehydrogenase / diacetyl reductase